MHDTLHATCVAWQGNAVLIMGKSGSGKSVLGLQLMALGCDLVADDQTQLHNHDATLVASPPDTIAGLIEARGVGILTATHMTTAQVTLVVDLDQLSDARLPDRQTITLLGCDLPLICRTEGPHFTAAILQFLKSGFSNR